MNIKISYSIYPHRGDINTRISGISIYPEYQYPTHIKGGDDIISSHKGRMAISQISNWGYPPIGQNGVWREYIPILPLWFYDMYQYPHGCICSLDNNKYRYHLVPISDMISDIGHMASWNEIFYIQGVIKWYFMQYIRPPCMSVLSYWDWYHYRHWYGG